MKEKLVRNTSNAKSRQWWEAVQAAAANAPKVTYGERETRSSYKRSASTKSKRGDRSKKSKRG